MNELIIGDILKNLRGSKDCMSASKILGHSYNQYFKLEAGYKVLRVEDFVKICELFSPHDLKTVFRDALDINIDKLTQENIISAYCIKWGQPTDYVLKNEMKMTTSKWWRIKNNKSALSFYDFLKLIDATSGKVIEFLHYFITDQNVKDKLFDKECNITALNFLEKYPEAALIMTGVYIQKYIDAPLLKKMDILQKITGLDDEKFEYLITHLISKGICYTDTDGNIKTTAYKKEIRNPDASVSRSLFHFITDRQKEDLPSLGKENSILKCNMKIISISEKGKAKIIEEIKNCYYRINEIAENEEIDQRDRLMLYQQAFTTIEND